MVTIVMPISRDFYLKQIFDRLEFLECDASKVNLIVYIDGNMPLYDKTYRFVMNSKFSNKQCIYRRKGQPNVGSVKRRRQRIADIHNELKQLIPVSEYVLLLEDDTIIPNNALVKLLNLHTIYPHAGFVSGVEIGRWGYTHIGAWLADDVYHANSIVSVPKGSDVQEVDAAGIYCCLMRYPLYIHHDFRPFEDILGPDVNMGLELRRTGYFNYINHSIQCTHLTKKGMISFNNTEIVQVELKRINDKEWAQGLYEG